MLQKEHMAIRARKNPEDPINYDDYKSMRFTRAVSIQVQNFLIVNFAPKKNIYMKEYSTY